MTPKLNAQQLKVALTRAFTDATNSGEIARMNAVHAIIEKEAGETRNLDDLIALMSHDPVDFILVAAPGFNRELKLATGRTRNEWAALIN